MININAVWHHRHPMPKNPTLVQRVRWHVAHAAACACREMPATVVSELRRRRIAVPKKYRARRTVGAGRSR
jgi:hypothetical protein